ncbi:MAG: 1-phosphofructokinase [Armatimonadota bacterium]|nr:1-phosphofructokinase [Armatimonadota bacterium]
MIATVTLNPALDKTIYLNNLLVHDANRIVRLEQDAGGKGVNASRVLKELGSETVALGFIGGATGSYIEHVLTREGIPTDFVHIKGVTRTNIAIQEVDGSPPTMLNEPGPEITDAELQELLAKVKSAASRSYAVLFGGSVTSGVPKDIYRTLIRTVRSEGALPVLDTDGQSLIEGLLEKPYMIKPNIDEAGRLVGTKLQSEAEVVNADRQLCDRGVYLVVISMGKDGAIAATNGECWFAMPPEVPVVSTIGSGDSMVAGILHTLANGGSLEEALRLGSAAGAATAMTNGAEIGKSADILRLIDQVTMRRIEM